MTIQEWINQNLSFYHITPTRNLINIYDSGIENRNGRGICVIRTNNEQIVRYICEMMLIAEGDSDFSIIEIKPNDIQLTAIEVINDNVVELTNDLHNYIVRDRINITEANVIGTFQTNPMGIPDLTEFENEIRNSGILERLN